MNYFELYQLPVNFHPNQVEVKQQFYALSKKYHPDFYINESNEKQNEVLELSTLNNKAFQVLKNPIKTLQYVLNLKDVLVEGENYSLPQAFLMEMMDVNEAIMDLQFDPDVEKSSLIKQDIEAIEHSLNENLEALTQQFDQEIDKDVQASLLQQIKDVYYRNKYVQRLKESVLKL